MDRPKDPWPRVLSLPKRFVGDPASLAHDNIVQFLPDTTSVVQEQYTFHTTCIAVAVVALGIDAPDPFIPQCMSMVRSELVGLAF